MSPLVETFERLWNLDRFDRTAIVAAATTLGFEVETKLSRPTGFVWIDDLNESLTDTHGLTLKREPLKVGFLARASMGILVYNDGDEVVEVGSTFWIADETSSLDEVVKELEVVLSATPVDGLLGALDFHFARDVDGSKRSIEAPRAIDRSDAIRISVMNSWRLPGVTIMVGWQQSRTRRPSTGLKKRFG